MNIELDKSNSKTGSKSVDISQNVSYNFAEFEKVLNEPHLDPDELNFDDFDDAHDKPVFNSNECDTHFQVNLENAKSRSHSSTSSKKFTF